MSLGICTCSIAQTARATGKVVDASTGAPISNVYIKVNDIATTSTNTSGEFTVDCSDSIKITLSHIGYHSFSKTLSCSGLNQILLEANVNKLDEVQVTATSNPNHSQLEQPVSISRLTTTDLKRSTGLFLDDAINTSVPGVTMQRRTVSGGQQLNIRGYGNGIGIRGISGNFDSQGLKMYLNGIPITDAEGITMMDDLDFASVNNVEIIKGPSGTLYGLAIAGVVSLQTGRAEMEERSVSQNAMVGSYGLLRTTTRLALGSAKSSVMVNYGKQKFDGFMTHTASEKDFMNVISDFNLADNQDISVYLGYSNGYDERNGELTKEQYQTRDYSGNARYIKNDAHSAVRTFRAGLSHSYRFNNKIANTTSLFGSSQNMDNSSAGGWTDKAPLNYGLRTTFDKNFKISGNLDLTGITGLELQKMSAVTVGYGMSADSTNLQGYNTITNIRSNQATTSATSSFFTQWTMSTNNGISITAGIGLGNMKVSLEDRLWGLTNNHPGNTKRRSYDATYHNLISPSFAINKNINKVASIYANYSVGYKAPVASNVLIPVTGQLNTGLKPEKGTQVEVGTKGSLMSNRLFYTVAVFNTTFKDKFTAVTVQNPNNTATLYSYLVNGGSLNNNGLEVFASYNVLKSDNGFFELVRPFANVTYSDFQYEDFRFQKVGKDESNSDITITEDYSGKTVAGVAPLVYNIGVDVTTHPGFYGNVNYNYRSAMYYTSDEANETNSFGLLNAKLGFRKSLGQFDLDVYAGANNLTGKQYYYMMFINQLPDAYIPAPDESNFFGGINLKYNF